MPIDLGKLAGGFVESTGELLLGFAVGEALHKALEPESVELGQAAWKVNPVRAVDPITAAAIVAENVQARPWGAGEALAAGIDGSRFDAIVGELLNAPGLPSLFEAWRRDLIDDGTFTHGLRKAKLEPLWDQALHALKARLLSLDELANARQQGFVDKARQLDESRLQGLDEERAEILFELSGLPPGVDVGQRAANRNLVDRPTFDAIVREGHTKTKYTDLLWAMRQPILGATDYAGLYLRGWITKEERDAGGALSGYSPAQMEQLYLERGRPAAPVQMFTAWARGVDGPDGVPMDEAQFLKGVKESDIRPEWGPMLWGIRHAYPSLFQLRAAVQNGGITPARALTIMRYQRYEDADATAIVAAWVHGGGAAQKAETKAELRTEYEAGYVTEAEFRTALTALGFTGQVLDREVHLGDAARIKTMRDRVVDAIRDEYLNHEIDENEATARLGTVHVLGEGASGLLALWTFDRDQVRRRMTEAQLAKAYKKGLLTKPVALERLADLGYSSADATQLLAEA